MSDQPNAGAFVDDVFSSIMGVLAPDEAAGTDGAPAAAEGAPAGAGNPPAGGDAGAAGAAGAPAAAEPGPGQPAVPAAAGDGGAAGSPAGADAGGDRGDQGAADAGSAGGDRAPAGTVDFAAVAADLGGLSQKFEETTSAAFKQQALEGIQTEYKTYFDALRQHPRMLVGQQVPALNGKDGEMETLRDAADAREWQDAVKTLLTEEVNERATKSMEENEGIFNTVHASIELFANNKDLVPGTRQFDRQLADRFAGMVKPYELRVEGKLYGYTIPVQPLIESLRAALTAERAAARPAAGSPAAAATARPGARSAAPADAPQAGIGSKAGAAGGEAEDFSTLFGTLGLPNLRI